MRSFEQRTTEVNKGIQEALPVLLVCLLLYTAALLSQIGCFV